MNDTGNPIKEAFEISSIQRGIVERRKIIEEYKIYGVLDRYDAIQKIRELRCTDDKVSIITAVNLVKGGRAFNNCPDSQLVNELQMQLGILEAELLEKTEKRNDE